MTASWTSGFQFRARIRSVVDTVVRERFGFVWGAATNVVTTTLAFWVAPYAQLPHLMIIHLLGAVLISTRYGLVVSTFTAVTGSLAFDYFCMAPIFGFALPDAHSVVIFAGMLAVALFVCSLNQGLRDQRAIASASEARTLALCELSLDLSRVAGIGELVRHAEARLQHLFGADARISLHARPELAAKPSAGPDGEQRQDTNSVVELQPVVVGEHELGQISIDPSSLGSSSAVERRLLLAACADRVADALRRLTLADEARSAQVAAETERSRNALLSAVSHDMKTPLASILTAGTSLLSPGSRTATTTREMLETIVQETERLNGMITNLLSVTRLESGAAVLNRRLEALDDLIFGVLSRLSGRLEGRELRVDVPDDTPMVPMDPVLVDQLLVNVLENALRYTPADSPIDVRLYAQQGELCVEISDRGPGFGEHEQERVFERFYRGLAAGRNDGGTGLGLTICRAVARAHGGEVKVSSRPGGGASVRFSLPLEAPLPSESRMAGAVGVGALA
jgi:two-component system sensor histidine kinase KdpD